LQLRMRNRIQQSLNEHRDIVRAIELGNDEAAAVAAREHVLIQGQRFNDFISLAEPVSGADADISGSPRTLSLGL
jgi:DNA-binding FadR family transcriptional regulator